MPHQKTDPRLKKNWKWGIRDSAGTVAQPPLAASVHE
jgi:hypothetical protein